MVAKRQNLRAGAGGFSLVELLVVVGIIILLLSILLPALASAKKQSYVTSTTAELGTVRAGCEAYFTTFGAYPGVFKETDIAGTSATTVTPLTGTQNLVISLMGGLSTTLAPAAAPAGSTAVTVNGTTMNVLSTPGSGPVDVTPGNGNKQYASFYTSRGTDVSAASGTTGSYAAMATLMDHFPDALPVLYFRHTVGVTSPTPGADNTSVKSYYLNCNFNYSGCATLKTPSGIVYRQDGYVSGGSTFNPFATAGNLQTAITNNSVAAGGFVLIAAGPSRYYGTVTTASGTTNDNIVVLGGQ